MSTLKRRTYSQELSSHDGEDNLISFSNGCVIPIYAISKITEYDGKQESDGITWSHRIYLNNGDVSLVTKDGYNNIINKIKKLKLT